MRTASPPRARRLADENAAPAHVSTLDGARVDPEPAEGRPPRGVWTADDNLFDRGVAIPHVVDRDREHRLPRLQHALRRGQVAHERDADDARAGLGLKPQLEVGIGVERVVLPLGIAEDVAGVARRRRPSWRLAADLEPLQQHAVEADVELLGSAEPADVVHVVSMQANPDLVLAVDREVVIDRGPAARPERQFLAHPIVLNQQDGYLVALLDRRERRAPDGEPRDPARHGQVPLEKNRRDGQHIGDVVEALFVDVVGRQLRRDIDVERKQVTNRVLIFGAIQAVERCGPSWIHPLTARCVERRFEPVGSSVDRRLIGPRRSGGRHRTVPKLDDHSFPELDALADLAEQGGVQHQAACFEAIVMARRAVSSDQRAVSACCSGLKCGRWRGNRCRCSRSRREPDASAQRARDDEPNRREQSAAPRQSLQAEGHQTAQVRSPLRLTLYPVRENGQLEFHVQTHPELAPAHGSDLSREMPLAPVRHPADPTSSPGTPRRAAKSANGP